MKVAKARGVMLIASLVVLGLVLKADLCFAQKEDKEKPVRSVSMAAEYPGIQIPVDENVNMDIIFHNKGKPMRISMLKLPKFPWDGRPESNHTVSR